MPARTVQLLTGVIQAGLIALILWTPIPFASVGSNAILGIEIFAVVLGAAAWAVVLLDRERFPRPARIALIPALGIVAIGVIQLLPLSEGWVRVVAPEVARLRETVGQGAPIDAAAQANLTPASGVDALARFASYVWIGFAAAVGLRTRRALQLVAVAIALSAGFQGLYGAFETLSGRQHILGVPKVHYTGDATGTFVNRNHYAAYLAMAMPVALALLTTTVTGSSLPGWRNRLLRFTDPRFLLKALLSIGLACVWLGVVLSYSRAGLAVAVVATLIAGSRLWRRRLTLGLAVAALAIPTVYLLYQDVRAPGARLTRLAVDATSDRGRVPVWRGTVGIAADHWLLGSGFGSFEAAFPLYRPPSVHARWRHAHNDWLQAAAEGGWLTPLLVLAIGIPVVRRRENSRSSNLARAIRLGALAGIVAVALHSLVDFPLKIPAVAVLVAVLVGIRCAEIPLQLRLEEVD